jgi:hypothetical protein
MSEYRVLKCETCDVVFPSLVGTEPNELIEPDWERAKEQLGEVNAGLFRNFYDEHSGHRLVEQRIEQ